MGQNKNILFGKFEKFCKFAKFPVKSKSPQRFQNDSEQ